MSLSVYGGQCHCGAVKFRLKAPKHLVAWDCNCSVCIMKKNAHFVVPQDDFILLPCVPEEERINADDAWKEAAEASIGPYKAHWGLPPKCQTRDLRQLPGGYGMGSGTLANWIDNNMKLDECKVGSSVLEKDHPCISTYTWNTHTARHTFCKLCGVQSFYHPRSNPDGVGVTLSCLVPNVPISSKAKANANANAKDEDEDEAEDQNICTSEIRIFDGQNWEDYIEGSGIREFSKVSTEEG